MARQLAATYRGRLEPFARTDFSGFAISMTEASARLLSQHPRVELVQGVDSAAAVTPVATASAEMPATPSATPLPATQRDVSTAVAVHSAAVNLQPRTNDTGSTWSTGVYAYDGSGNITAAGSQVYQYDRLGRVTSGTAGPGKQQSYTYDRYGNVETITTAANPAAIVRRLGVNQATNQASNNASQYDLHGTYDAAGNVKTWSTGETFEYDGLGMVRHATLDGAKQLYIYSATDERIATISLGPNDVETHSMWTIRDMSGKVLRRLQKTGAGSSNTWTWKQDYIYRGTQLLASETDGPERTLHFHPDHLGTPRLITGSGGAKVSLHTYYPFGEEATNPLQDTERLKFTGHERDTSRLDYMHARYYNPTAGAFLSIDPSAASIDITSPQTWNRYAYGRANPLKYIDPTGAVVEFANRNSERAYRDYRDGLAPDSEDYQNLVMLENSEVTYVITVEPQSGKQEGELKFDGKNVIVSVAPGGPDQDASLNSRLAHEIQHAVQFDTGMLGFVRGPRAWSIIYNDIHDEVDAWNAGLRRATDADFSTRTGNIRGYSLATDKAAFLIQRAYPQYAKRSGVREYTPRVRGVEPGSMLKTKSVYYRTQP